MLCYTLVLLGTARNLILIISDPLGFWAAWLQYTQSSEAVVGVCLPVSAPLLYTLGLGFRDITRPFWKLHWPWLTLESFLR